MKCTVPVFHPRSSCNRTGAHPSILLKEAPTCANAEKNASSAAAKKAFPAVVKLFFLQRTAIQNARMEKIFKITYMSVTLWPVFNTNISNDEVMVFNL